MPSRVRPGSYHTGCRCAACTEENRLRAEARRRRLGVLPWVEYRTTLTRTHGIRTTYKNGCRCEACTDAEREYRRDYRARKAGRA